MSRECLSWSTAKRIRLSEKFQCLFKIRMRRALYCPEWRAVVTRRRYVTAIKDFHLPYLRRRVGGFYFSRVSRHLEPVENSQSFHTLQSWRENTAHDTFSWECNSGATLAMLTSELSMRWKQTKPARYYSMQPQSKNSYIVTYHVNAHQGNVI